MDLRRNLECAVEYGVQTGSFSKINQAIGADWVCVFGLGRYFEEAFDYWNFKEKLGVNILCDNNPDKWGKEYRGLKCISPEALYQLDNVIVIPMIGDFSGVEQQLIEHGIKYIIPSDICFEMIADMPQDRTWFQKNGIMRTYDMLADETSRKLYSNILCNRIAQQFSNMRYSEMKSGNEYFNPEFFEFSDDEVLVDCGAYTGDSMETFIACVHNEFEHIYAFEMDGANYKLLLEKKNSYDWSLREKISCIPEGVWHEDSLLEYGKEEFGANESFSLLKSENGIQVRTVKLDTRLEGKRVTMIKMDIEGAELNALKGAEKIIQEQKPKLAICIYHKLSDFWEIPMYLKGLVPEYKLSIRHHQKDLGGTVLYAYF